jgi:ribosomal protein L7Ae-like RNA K-turn-binding protein
VLRCCRETAKAVEKGKAKLVVVAPNIEEVTVSIWAVARA